MTRRADDLADIKQGLKDRITELCRALLPDGRAVGRLWIAHNPVEMDFDKSPEFKVALNRDTGAWKDWRTGEKGDVIRLIEYVKGCSFKEALTFARDFLGLRDMTYAERRELANRTREAAQRADEDADRRRLERMEKAEKLFLTGYQDGSNSAAESHARRYFAARAVPLADIANRDTATMRFNPAQEYWKRATWENLPDGRRRKVKPGPAYPAILTAMRLPTGQVSAVHMTFLDPLGPQKLPVDKNETAKQMFGEAKGAMIRISHGPEGEPPETARQAHPLVLCEGIEDGLSLAIACPEARVWAAGSLSALAAAPVWMACISAVIVARDNDWQNKQAIQQFERAIAALSAHGKPVVEISAHAGKDFNDLIKGDE